MGMKLKGKKKVEWHHTASTQLQGGDGTAAGRHEGNKNQKEGKVTILDIFSLLFEMDLSTNSYWLISTDLRGLHSRLLTQWRRVGVK